ncbi:hypothetical protein QAD02_015543 [Eretmocerus hayati]|uniref:Uncharacterized protein n=1 Tax=Eretmocerus hayati TaxID=131215 RepID=A0ACC2P9T6_9HYME|nr:hypothetical protein QAD02_015543 [Eretmocerus hayati]
MEASSGLTPADERDDGAPVTAPVGAANGGAPVEALIREEGVVSAQTIRYFQCKYLHCRNSSLTAGVQLYSFPTAKDPNRQREWITRSGNETLHGYTASSLASQKICGDHFEPGDIKVNPVTQKSRLLPNKRPIHWRDAQMRARENEAARRQECHDQEAASHENDLHVVTPSPVSDDHSISQCESILPDATVHCTPPSSNSPLRPSRDQSPEQPLDDQQLVIESIQGAIPDPLSAFDQFILRERVPDDNDIPLEVNRSS